MSAVDVARVRFAILKFAHDSNIDSAVLIQAMAEVIGMTAHVLDRDIGYQNFDERMATFRDHARAWYLKGPPKHAEPVLPSR